MEARRSSNAGIVQSGAFFSKLIKGCIQGLHFANGMAAMIGDGKLPDACFCHGRQNQNG
ncbi:hypothetical protein HMPREF9554_03025, partial [Treponema phagedenis F0421]